MKIAVDFDGTIVEHAYPRIGKDIPFAFETLCRLQKEHRLILWTVREGKLLQEAIEYCRRKGLEFYAVNSNGSEDEMMEDRLSCKINADLFIDDRNVGGLPDWGTIYRIIKEKRSFESLLLEGSGMSRKKSLRDYLKGVISFF